MSRLSLQQRSGAAIIAMMLVAIVILGSMLMLTTSALVTVGNTSRALDLARQNSAIAARLERLVREAAIRAYGAGSERGAETVSTQLGRILPLVGFGDVDAVQIVSATEPRCARGFPDFAGPPGELRQPSSELAGLLSPRLAALIDVRGNRTVAESTPFSVALSYTRAVLDARETYPILIEGRIVAVPLTRWGFTAYELPHEIGKAASLEVRPSHIPAAVCAPRGLIPSADPAHIDTLAPGKTNVPRNRPAHFRHLAALADAYQYVFSEQYVQRCADYAGVTHFVVIGAGAANPQLSGGKEEGGTYELDLGRAGRGVLGTRDEEKNLLIVCAADVGRRIVLSDSIGTGSPLLLLVLGPGGAAPAGALEVEITTDIGRPVVIVGYNVVVASTTARSLNGALLLDPLSSVAPMVGPITIGHLSCSATGSVSPDAFRIGNMPPAAELLAPRVAYVATARGTP